MKKYVTILSLDLLLFAASLPAAEPKTPAEDQELAVSADTALPDEKEALWEKIGPHAKEGSQLAKDNRAMFDVYYRLKANDLGPEVKAKDKQVIFSLMCIPTAYGWPMYRTLSKDIKYTGLVAVRAAGNYEVLVEVSTENPEARIVLEIDGEALDRPIKPNEKVSVQLDAGVRALSVRTIGDAPIQFGKLHLDRIVLPEDGDDPTQEPGGERD